MIFSVMHPFIKKTEEVATIVYMNDKEKQTYDDLMNSFKNAESIEESRYYFVEIQLYLDSLQSTNELSITKPQMEEYQRLRKELLDSTSKKEVSYYEDQIHKWLNKIHRSKLT